MARSFNLTAEINLRAPGNLKTVVSEIRRELGTVSANVNLKLDAKSGKSIDSIKNRLESMNAVLVTARNNTESLSSALQSLSSSLGTVSSAGSKTSGIVVKTGTAAKQAATNIKAAATGMEEFGRQSFLAIKRFAAFSVVTTAVNSLTGAISSGLTAFINYDRELVRLQQVTGKSGSELRSLEKAITDLSVNLGVSSEGLTSVAVTLAQAGLTANETRIALAALAKTELAPSFDDIAQTTEGAIAALRQFDLTAGDLEAALGSINAVAAAFAVEADDLISAIQRSGGVFAAASKGVSEGTDALNEFLAIFTSVRQTTRESAETIATGLRTIFTRIQRAGTINQLREFGIELTDLEGKFVGPYEAVRRLSEGLKQLDPRDIRFSSIVEELGGFRQIGKVIPLIQQFTVAQEALKVAQKGQGSLAEAQAIAQLSLANRIAQVREQFLALIRDVGKSQAFQGLFTIVTKLASGMISLVSAFKPILPILAIIGSIKGVKAIGDFAGGFFGAFSKGSARGTGENIGSTISGTKDKERSDATNRASEAIKANTTALNTLTTAVNALSSKIGAGGTTLSGGGKVLGFNKGGMVPGNGGGDRVPAMLEGGEVVMNRRAVKAYGAGNLLRMNKHAGGGEVFTKKIPGAIAGMKDTPPIGYNDISKLKINNSGKGAIRGYFFENFVNREFNVDAPENKFPDIPNLNVQKGLKEKLGLTKAQTGRDFKAAELKYRSGLKADFNSQYTPENTAILYAINKKLGGKIQKFMAGGVAEEYYGKSEVEAARSAYEEFQRAAEEAFNLENIYFEIPEGKSIAEGVTPEVYGTGIGALAKGQPGIIGTKQVKFGATNSNAQLLKDLKVMQASMREAALKAREAQLEAYAQAEESIVAFKTSGLLENIDPGIVSYIKDTIASLRDGTIDPEIWDSKSVKKIRAKLTDPNLEAFDKLMGEEAVRVSVQGQRTKLSEVFNRILETYGSNVSQSEQSNITSKVADITLKEMAAKKANSGGIIQKFMAGGATEQTKPTKISNDILKSLRDLGGKTGIVSYYPSPTDKGEDRLVGERLLEAVRAAETKGSSIGLTSKQLFDARTLGTRPDGSILEEVLKTVIDRAEAVKKAKQQKKTDQLARNMQAAAGQAYQFGLVSLYGPNGELGYSDVSDAKELVGSDGTTKYLAQIVRKSLPTRYADAVKKIQEDIAGVPTRGAEQFQYTDIFGFGGPLAFDFDDTLVKGADIFAPNGGIDIRAYNDLNKVKEALANSQLTLLGKELAKRLIDYPQLMDSVRVLTARPPSNAPLLASKLASLGLPIPESKITGVTGGLNKVENLSEMEMLIDDNLENIQAVLGAGKQGYLYSEPEGIDKTNPSVSKAIAGMEGYGLELIPRSLGINISPDDADPGRPIDYAKGLGLKGANLWGISPTLPTDTKRTNDSSALSRLWGEAQRYFTQNFALGGLAEATNEMSGLMSGLYGNRQQEQAKAEKKEKQFGKIALRDDGNTLSATYFKNDQRSGNVTAYKMRDYLYYVGLSQATGGYGPRLYDVVMEAATANGGMLTSDRSSVSGDAKRVWEYYFNNRGDVKKTPLKPDDWTKNQSMIDPKLFGPQETWPPATDPAWVLQSGYSKSASLINDPNSVIRMDKQMDSRSLAANYFAASAAKLAKGGSANDTIPAMVSNQEGFVPPKLAKKIGYAKLDRINQADRNGMSGFAEGGISKFKGPGSGTSDSIGPIGLPKGSYVIRAKAMKAMKLNKGGIVGTIQRFFRGGVAEKDVARAQGSVIQDVKQAEKTFAMIMGQLGKNIRESIIKPFKGIEDVEAGTDQKLITTGKAFTERTRGRAVMTPSATAMGLQIGGQKVKATTETVAHEAGHLADYQLGGGKGDFASDTKGTFQFALIEKIKPVMEQAFFEAGESALDISNYLATNRELFAEFFAKASPQVRAIITSTTDAATGMKALAEHLGETGYTYGGLEASDIGGATPPSSPQPKQPSAAPPGFWEKLMKSSIGEPPVPLPTPTPPVSPSPPTPPSGPPIVPPSGPPTVPPSGPPAGGGGSPPSGGGGTPTSGGGGAAPPSTGSPDAQKYLELTAKSAGMSVEEFVKTLRKAANEGAAAIKDGLAKAQIELNRGIIEASANFSKITTPSSVLQRELDGLADQLKAVDDKDPKAKTKREDLREQIREKQGQLGKTQAAESGIREALISQIKAASVGKSESEITSIIESALKSLETNTLSSNDELKALLSRTLDTKDATDIAGRAAAGQYGNADLLTQATGDLTDTSTNFQKAVEYFGGPLKATTRSMLLASSAIQAGSKAFLESGILSKQAIESLGPTLAGISGGVSGGAQSAAVVAELDIGKNAQSFGKILEGFGGRIGTAGQFLQTFSGSLQAGAIAFALVSGAIKGFADAFNQAKLDQNLERLSLATDRTTEAFKRFEKNPTATNATIAKQAVENEIMAGEDLRLQSGVDRQGRNFLDTMRDYDFTGITASVSGQAAEKEATKAYVANRARTFEQQGKLGEQRLQTVDPKQIEATVNSANEADNAIKTLVDELELLKSSGASVAAVSEKQNQVNNALQAKYDQLYKKSQRFGQIASVEGEQEALRQFFVYAASTEEERLKRQEQFNGRLGKTEEERLANQEKAIAEAKRLAGEEAETESRTRLLADATKALNLQTENLLRTYSVASSILQRFSEDIDLIKESANATASAIEGRASIGNVDRTNERVLSNIQGYSREEVRAAAIQTGELAGGGAAGQQLQNQVLTAKVLQESLPQALATTSGENVGDVITKLENAFREANVEFSDAAKTELKKNLEKETASRDGVSFDKLAQESDVVANLLKQTEAGLKAAQDFQKRYNDALSVAIELQNSYAQALSQSIDYQIKAAEIRTNSRVQLKEALGQRVTGDERTAAFDTRIQALTSTNVVPGGTTDPDKILQQLLSGVQGQETQQKELDRRKQEFAAAPTEANKARVAEQMQAMAKQNVAINNNRKALEELANDSSKAAEALKGLQELDRIATGATNFARQVLTSDAEQLSDIGKQLSAFNKLRSGKATDRDMNSLEFRRAAFAGGDLIKSVIPKEIAERLDAQTSLQMLESNPQTRAMLDQTVGGIGPKDEKMTLRALLEQKASGAIDPVQQKYIDAYTAATEVQAKAAQNLATAAQEVAQTFNDKMIAVLDKLQQTLPAILEQAVTAGMKPAAASAYKELNAATKEKQALDTAQAGKMGIDTTQFSSLSSAFDSASAAQKKKDTLIESKAKQAGVSVDTFMASDAGKEYQKSDEYKNAENARKAAEQNFATTAQSMGLSPEVAEEISAYRNTTSYTQAEAKIKQKEEAFKAAQAGPPPTTPPRTTPQEMPIAPDANAARQQAKEKQDARSIYATNAAWTATGAGTAVGAYGGYRGYRNLRERFFGTKPTTPTPGAVNAAPRPMGAPGSIPGMTAPDMATGSAGGGVGPSKVATPKVKAPVKSRFKMPKIKGRGKAALLAAGAAGLGYLFGGGGGEETTGGEQAGAATATAGGAENALALAEAMINIQNATINIGTATIGGSPVPATAQQAQTDAAVQAAEQEMVAEEGNPFVEAAALGGNLIAGTGSYALAEKAVASASKPVVTAADDALAAGAKTTASESVETAAKNAVAAAAKTGAVEATEAVAKTGLIQTAKSTVQTIAKSKGVLSPKGSVAGTAALVGTDLAVGAMGGEDAVFGERGTFARETYDTGRDVAGAGIVAAGGGVGIAINTVADGLYTGYELITDTNNKLAEWNDSSELDEFNTKIQAYGNGVGHLVGAVDAAAAGFTRPIDTFGNALTTAGSTLNQIISNIQQQGKIQSQEESAKTNQLVYDEKTGTVNKQAMSQSDPLYGLSRSEQLFARREATLKTQLATATQVQGGGGGVADYAKLIGASEADYANTDMAKVIETINAELASLEKQKVSERTAGNLLPNSLTGAGQDTAQYDKAVTSLMADQARDTAVVAEMAKQATQPGSIFTHDVGTHDRLDKLLGVSPAGSLAGGAGQLAGVAQSLNANIGSGMTTLLNKLPTGGGDILKTGYEAVGKLLDPKALSENMAGAGSNLLSSLINPTDTLQSLLSTKKTDVGVGANPFMTGGSLASTLAAKNDIITPAATDPQSNLLSQILAVLKECCSALNTKAMAPTVTGGAVPSAIPAPPAPGTPQALTTPVPVSAVAPATTSQTLATPSTAGLVPMPELALNKAAEQQATKPQITAKKAEESVKLETDQQKVIDASRKAKQKEIDKLQKRVDISKRNLKFSTDPTKDSKIQENLSKNEAALASAKEDLSMIDQYEKDELQKVAKTKEIEAKLRNPLGIPTTTPLATPAAAYTSGVINASSLGSTLTTANTNPSQAQRRAMGDQLANTGALQQAYAAARATDAQASKEAAMMQTQGLIGPTPTGQRMADQFRSSMAPANATQQAVDWNDPALAGWTQDTNRRRNAPATPPPPPSQPISTPLQQNVATQQTAPGAGTQQAIPSMITIDPTSLTALTDFNKQFGGYVAQLSQIKLEVVGSSQHRVEVNITGASALQALDDKIKGLGVSLIADQLNALETKLNREFPEKFRAPGSGGKGSSKSTTAANQ